MASYPQTSGFRHSWAGLKIKSGPADVFGCRKISYKQTRERSIVYGHGVQALGRTRGRAACEGSITFLYMEWEDFKAGLGPGYMDKTFDLLVQREEVGNDRMFTDELISCTIDDVSKDDSEGTDASEVEVTLGILRIKDDSTNSIDGELE
jgi:hypothetical protein